MGGVFFRRKLVPLAEVINDISGDVITLLRILQRHYPQFMETLKFQITSLNEFERLSNCDLSTLTDLERVNAGLAAARRGGRKGGRPRPLPLKSLRKSSTHFIPDRVKLRSAGHFKFLAQHSLILLHGQAGMRRKCLIDIIRFKTLNVPKLRYTNILFQFVNTFHI